MLNAESNSVAGPEIPHVKQVPKDGLWATLSSKSLNYQGLQFSANFDLLKNDQVIKICSWIIQPELDRLMLYIID